MRFFTAILMGLFGFLFVPIASALADLNHDFNTIVQPFLKRHCTSCHGEKKKKGKLDLSIYTTTDAVARDYRRWDLLRAKLAEQEMPPEEADHHPSAEDRQAVIDWFDAFKRAEAKRNAGDPGIVLARRLSNAEYDHTIRDLTGVDIRPTREFPVDPANEAGFDNSGESLSMSPELLRKYLAAARHVAEHMVLKPEGFTFAPHPIVTESDRDKYCVSRLMDFYERHRVDLADYFLACWRYRHREALGLSGKDLERIAAETGLSKAYLLGLWSALSPERKADTPGPLRDLRQQWDSLPDPSHEAPAAIEPRCRELSDWVIKRRQGYVANVKPIRVNGMSGGTQPFVLWHNHQYAERRMKPAGTAAGADLGLFCRMFPDAFAVTSRQSYADSGPTDGVRWLSAGFHLMHGYYRDDRPLYELVLDDAERRELDRLWEELDFISFSPERQYKDFIFFERAEPPRFMIGEPFDFARSEDKDVVSRGKMNRLKPLYIALARDKGADDIAVGAIDDYFESMSDRIRHVETLRQEAEPRHFETLWSLVERAWRRPVTPREQRELREFYNALRQTGLEHEDALRDVLTSILVSPRFCYRINRAKGTRPQPLTDYELASRLSYFLWSSMPDETLFALAQSGDLVRAGNVVAQARRMMRNDRVRGLATEFGGNWLEFRRFQEHNSVDRERFPVFDDDLREAMFEEPVRFLADLVREDRSVLDCLYGKHTFVNGTLARHYGLAMPPSDATDWQRLDQANLHGRGGLLPMSVFLTLNAPGRRTSPVKRGYWVIRRLLGEMVPPPPPDVPDLPADEAGTGDLGLPELLARHREDPGCAGCHNRFDAIGLVFEAYGPVGERRDVDLGGRPVSTRAVFPDGSTGEGLDGLKAYLRRTRQEEFLDNLCRKLLAYALGRSLILSDEELIATMKARLAEDGYRFGVLVESIVTSRQFLMKRE